MRKLPESDFVWDDLKYFMMVATAGSITQAARSAKVEHSTVVRRITRLETALDTRLFDRLVRGWVLTQEGRALQEQTGSIEHQMLSVQRFALSRGKISGRLTLTAPPDLLSEVVVPALHGFQNQYPDIDLCLFGDLKEANLSRGEADVALRMTKVEGAELVTQRVCNVTYRFYGVQSLVQSPPERLKFIGYSQAHQPYLNHAIQRQANGRPLVLQTNSLRVALRAALDGMGVALLPTFLAAPAQNLHVVEPERTPITLPVYLVMQRDVRKADRVRILTDYIKNNLPGALAS